MGSRYSLDRGVRIAVALLAAMYAAYFSLHTCITHEGFRTFAYDLGTFDQGIWLAGHDANPFVTVRGLHLLGDHVRLFSYVLAPLYYLWDDVRALLVLQSIAIAAGAWFVCRIAQRAVPGRPWVALALSLSWLLHPAVQNLNLDHAHPDAFSSTLILAAVDALQRSRVGMFWLAAALAMSCKEDVPLVFVAMGLVLIVRGEHRRLGVALAATATTYFALCMLVILPHFNGRGFFRFDDQHFLGGAGSHATDVAWLFGRIVRTDTLTYLLALGAPFAFVFALAPLWLVPAVPSLMVNLLSDAYYMRSFDFHYQTSILPFVYIATTEAIARLSRSNAQARLASVVVPLVLMAATVAANVVWSKAPVHRLGDIVERWKMVRSDRRIAEVERVLAKIPADAVVSADYFLLPHLSHRRRIYMFPNPFRTRSWGINDEGSHDPEDVEYIVVHDAAGFDPIVATVQDLKQADRYVKIDGNEQIALFRRLPPVRVNERSSCGDWDGDGKVTDDDLRRIADAILNHRECPMRVCDADGDGALHSMDVLRIDRSMRGAHDQSMSRADNSGMSGVQPLACPP